MNIFFHERKPCETFQSKNKSFKIEFSINSKEVVIVIDHVRDWNIGIGKFILTQLWNNFKLPVLGWQIFCKALNYNSHRSDEIIAEYRFSMKDFHLENIFDNDFLEYDNKYDFYYFFSFSNKKMAFVF